MNDDDLWFRQPESLGAPLALMGLVIGSFGLDFMHTLRWAALHLCFTSLFDLIPQVEPDWELRIPLGLLFMVGYGIAGRWVAGQLVAASPPKRTMALALAATGASCAVLIGVFSLGAFLAGMLLAATTTMLLAPFALLLAHNAHWAWQARQGSVLHDTYRKARWIDVATGTVVVLAVYANPVFGMGVGGVSRAVVATLLVAAAAMMASGLAVSASSALRRVGKLRTRFDGAATGMEDREHEAPVFDMGLGDVRRQDVAGASSAYRHQEQVTGVVVGDVQRAWRVVAMSVGRAVTVVGIGLVVLAVHTRLALPVIDSC